MSVEKCLDDKTYCKSVSKSIAEIIRFSLNEEFRKKSFELFEVSNTKDTEREIKKRLMFLLQNKTTVVSQKRNVSAQTEKENTDAQNDNQSTPDTFSTPSTSTDSDSQSTSQNIFKRHWLQTSSLPYREIIKRKKLNYYSQPQLSEWHHGDLEFHTSRTCSSDSQQSSNSELFKDEKISLSQPSNDTDYFKEKFKNSFREASKYFRRNLKSQKFLSGGSQTNRKF